MARILGKAAIGHPIEASLLRPITVKALRRVSKETGRTDGGNVESRKVGNWPVTRIHWMEKLPFDAISD